MPQKKKKPGKQHEHERKKIILKNSESYNEPEDDYVISSPFYNKAVVLKPQDIKQKLIIASNITLECKQIRKILTEGENLHGKLDLNLETLHEFTNMPKRELKSIFDSVSTRDRSFTKTLKDIRIIPEPVFSLLADDIRSIFFKYITQHTHFPCKKLDLLKDLKILISQYTHETIPLQRLVRNKLVKYQLFPKLYMYLITEHPERVYQRTMYLNQIKEYRLQDKNFVYVEVKRIIPRGAATGFIAGLAASPAKDLLEKFFTKDSTEMIAKKWLQQRILPIVPENSVIVIAQPNILNDLTCMSEKKDLMAWLDLNDIPYENDAHTAVLYELFDKNKSKIKRYGTYDHVFLNAGYSVINISQEWRSLNFFHCIWSDVNIVDAYQPIRPEALKQKILSSAQMLTNLKDTEARLVQRELKMMKEDKAMETVIENLREMIKDGLIDQSDFSRECCGDKSDNFETNISKYIVDIGAV